MREEDDRCDKCREHLMYGAKGLTMGACCICKPQLVLCAACFNEHMTEKHGAPADFSAEADYESL